MSIYDLINNKVNKLTGLPEVPQVPIVPTYNAYTPDPRYTNGGMSGIPTTTGIQTPNNRMITPTAPVQAPVQSPTTTPAPYYTLDLSTASPKIVNGVMQPSVVNPPPPPGSAASIGYTPIVNLDQAAIDAANAIVNDTTQITDPTTLYKNNLANYQAQIDSINSVYSDKLNQARIQGQGRIESRQFAQGRSGQIGSGTGEASVNAIQNANTEVYNSIEAEKANTLNAIYGKVREGAAEQLAANTAAKQQGAKALLEFYNVTKPTLKTKNTSTAVKALIAKGIDVSKLTPEELKSFTDGIGITKDEFVNAYNAEKKSVDDAKVKAEQDAMKALPAMAQEYEYAKKGGFNGSFSQYQNEDANRKAAAIKVPTTPEKVYTIKAGDTLINIANKLGLNPDSVISVNPSVNPLNLQPGQRINLPTSSTIPVTKTADIKSDIFKMTATPEFKSLNDQQKKDYIASQGGNPADYGY